jgi:hypothetical protein
LAAQVWQRWLGFLFFWIFLSWWRQAPGLIGPNGILPTGDYLQAVAAHFGFAGRLWYTPSLLWLWHGAHALGLLAALGMLAAAAMMLRWHTRAALAICLVACLSFLACAQVFADYQSDGMIMTAGLFSLFVDDAAPAAWAWFSLRWLWFTIYLGSGIAKLLSGDPAWHRLTALNQYYQNLPLPNWLGWYAQQGLPQQAQAAFALLILIVELGVVWLAILPRRFRIVCFWIVTPFQIAIILTANYGFLNYLVLGLGLSLIDDRHLRWLLRRGPQQGNSSGIQSRKSKLRLVAACVVLALISLTGYNLVQRVWPSLPAADAVNTALQPFRVADSFGLFAVMTPDRYEIEFQGSQDGEHWTAYPFRYKPQDPARRPVGDWFLFAPYQPRFDWNLWFASLSNYHQNPWVVQTELRLLGNDPAVLGLFAANPFADQPPRAVRAVLWQYWFATPEQKRAQHIWWSRKFLGLYAPEFARTPAGAAVVRLP